MLSISISCGFKYQLKNKLPEVDRVNYKVIHDSIIRTLRVQNIKRPYKLSYIEKDVKSKKMVIAIKVSDKITSGFQVFLDSNYNVLNWAYVVEVW
jgi:hypothetical protein